MNCIFLTVRINSSRLPNKALLKLNNGVSTIEFLINRLKTQIINNFDIILCTTNNKEDDKLIEISKNLNIKYFRGSEKDKLQRWYEAAIHYNVKNIVTVDGDDLFIETSLIEKAFNQLENNNVDFIKGDHTGLICGAFTYAFTFNSLYRVIQLKGDNDTEMMWVYFTDTGLFDVRNLENVPKQFYRNDIRMTLDYEEDMTFFVEVAKRWSKRDNLLH